MRQQTAVSLRRQMTGRRFKATQYSSAWYRPGTASLDWTEQCFTSPSTQYYSYMADGFYRSKDPTNSIKVLKEHHQMCLLFSPWPAAGRQNFSIRIGHGSDGELFHTGLRMMLKQTHRRRYKLEIMRNVRANGVHTL